MSRSTKNSQVTSTNQCMPSFNFMPMRMPTVMQANSLYAICFSLEIKIAFNERVCTLVNKNEYVWLMS